MGLHATLLAWLMFIHLDLKSLVFPAMYTILCSYSYRDLGYGLLGFCLVSYFSCNSYLHMHFILSHLNWFIMAASWAINH